MAPQTMCSKGLCFHYVPFSVLLYRHYRANIDLSAWWVG